MEAAAADLEFSSTGNLSIAAMGPYSPISPAEDDGTDFLLLLASPDEPRPLRAMENLPQPTQLTEPTQPPKDSAASSWLKQWAEAGLLERNSSMADCIRDMEESGRAFRWLFSDEELRNTPSVRAGVTQEQEMTFRQKQAMLIQTIGLKSGLTQLAVNTSVIFMHRFYMYRTIKAYPRVQLAIGFAFAGGKVEESARKLEHLIRTAVDVIRSNKNKEFLDKNDILTYDMDCQWRAKLEQLCQNNCNIESAAYLEMRKLVLECETEIYGVIGFQLQIVHPHNYVIRMCALLGAENIKDISQYAYNLATASSQLTMLCLKYKPETLATMCLNVAAKAHSVRFEPMKDSNVKWYQVIVPGTDFAEIEAVTEEFLHLLKGCPLLPSWMTNLARMSRVNNSRAMAGPSRAPGTSSSLAPQASRQSQPSATATSSSNPSSQPGNIPQSSSQTHSSRSSQQSASVSQGSDVQQSLGSSQGLGPQGEAVISPNSRLSSAEGAASAASDTHASQGHPSSYSRPHPSGSSSHVRPPHSSSGASQPPHHHHHHHQQQQHRPHPGSSSRPPNPAAPGSGGSRPPSKSLQSSGSTQVPGSRSSQHPPQPGSHSSSHPSSSRPPHDPSRPHHDPSRPVDQSRSHLDALRPEQSRPRDQPRPHDARSQDSSRNYPRPDRRMDPSTDSRRSQTQQMARDDAGSGRIPSSRPVAEQHHSQRMLELSPHTPPLPSPPAIKPPSPPEPAPEASNSLLASGDAPDARANASRSSSSPESLSKTQNLEPQKQRSLPNHGSKLSLSMYRERASARSRNVNDLSTSGEDANTSGSVQDELPLLEMKSGSATNSPADKSGKSTALPPEVINFTKPQDSPNNPPIKLKVKRDPSSGERLAVKYADTGIKLKIKPLRSESSLGPDGEAGPSGASSRSSTPREEGEIIEDTPPSSSSSSERKSEGLRIRLSVPKSDNGSGYSRRDSDQGSNGYSGERESGHRHHHGHHHRSHQHHKSKKHSSKHDRSRHEGKASKRSASSVDYYDERPAKSSRLETFGSASTAVDVAHRSGSFPDHTSSSRNLQHQNSNSGFSISDAFSSTMPHNIFDDDDDDAGHAHPPITPTIEAGPPHHERFQQLMAQHRARQEARRPPLPKGPPPPAASPPPPPPPPSL